MPWWHIGIGDVAPLNLYLATRLVLWSASSPDQYTYKETAPSTHWTREWESPRTGLDALRKSIWHQDCVNRASADLQIYLTTWWQANHVDNFSITNRSKDPLTNLTVCHLVAAVHELHLYYTDCYNSFVTAHADNCETPVSCSTYLSNIQGECSVHVSFKFSSAFFFSIFFCPGITLS